MGSDSTYRGDSMVRGDMASSTSLRGERAWRGLRSLTPCGEAESILFFFFFLGFTACSTWSTAAVHRGESLSRRRGPHIRTNIANAFDTSCGPRAEGRRPDAQVERVVHVHGVFRLTFDCVLPFILGRCSRCLCLLLVCLTNIELVLNDLEKCLTFAARRICGVARDYQSVQLHARRVSCCRPHGRCGEWNKLGRPLAHRLK